MHRHLNQLDRHDLIALVREAEAEADALRTELHQAYWTINDLKEELHYERHCVCNHTWACVRGASGPAVAGGEAEE